MKSGHVVKLGGTAVLLGVWVLMAGLQGAPPQWGAVITWNKTFGGSDTDDSTNAAQQTADGGYIAAGTSRAFDGTFQHALLIKTDASGTEEWSKTFGGTGFNDGISALQSSDGGYLMAGGTTDDTQSYAWLVKTDASGNELWAKTFNEGGIVNSFEQTNDDGLILAGFASGGAWLMKTDESGNPEWEKVYPSPLCEVLYSVRQTADGGYILAGFIDCYSSDVLLMKTDGEGNEQWTKTFGGAGAEEGHSVEQTSDGGYIVAGWTDSYGAGALDIWLIKTDANGNELWSKTFGDYSYDGALSVKLTTDGGYILAGALSGDMGDYACILKTDASGTEQWRRTYGGDGTDWFHSVFQTADGGYIAGGYTNSFGVGGNDLWLVKTDANGNAPATPSP